MRLHLILRLAWLFSPGGFSGRFSYIKGHENENKNLIVYGITRRVKTKPSILGGDAWLQRCITDLGEGNTSLSSLTSQFGMPPVVLAIVNQQVFPTVPTCTPIAPSPGTCVGNLGQ